MYEANTDRSEGKGNNVVIGRYVNTSLSIMGKSSRMKINKEMEEQSNTKDQINVIDTYRTFFSHAHRTFSNVDQLLGHKTNLSKFEKNESITNIFYNHNVMRIEINYKKKKKNCIKIKNTNSR